MEGAETRADARHGSADGSEGTGSSGGRRPHTVRRRRSLWKDLPFLVIAAVCLALLIKTFLIQVFFVPSGSMQDTLKIGDRIVVDKLSYRFGPVERGDVIVFEGSARWRREVTPTPPSSAWTGFLERLGEEFGIGSVGEKDFVKRVVGVPGDHVVGHADGTITVNGARLVESAYVYRKDRSTTEPFDVRVPAGRLWVMGDHRSVSADSRTYGLVPIDHVVGRADAVIWPIDDWSTLQRPDGLAEPGGSGASSGGGR